MQLPQYGQRLAEAVARDAGIKRRNLLEAFASIPRERFLGPPPWLIATPVSDGSGPRYVETSELSSVYDNVSVALDRSRQLYNGAPAIVATWLDALNPNMGDRCFHVGCGTGYYTAILAALVGSRGSVIAVDVEEMLIDQASDALAELPNVSLLMVDGTTFAPRVFDVGLVNAGLSLVPELWLSRMSPTNGRLVLPLTVPLPSRSGSNLSKGIVFLIERSGNSYAAKMIGVAIIFTAVQKTSELAQKRLLASVETGASHEVQSLRRDAHSIAPTCWLHEQTYCLSRLSNSDLEHARNGA